MRKALPGWTLYGIDRDGAALQQAHHRTPWLHLIQADARHLPALLHAHFGVILVRHPDLFRQRTAWTQIIPRLTGLLAPNGVLLITLYAPEEIELIQTLPLPPVYPLNESALPPVDLAGHDRFLLAFCTG